MTSQIDTVTDETVYFIGQKTHQKPSYYKTVMNNKNKFMQK